MTDPSKLTEPRVRFAPSPTGYFHVGSARSALFNWLFARQHDGTFVLRIEDTDEERNRDEWTDGIISALEWLGMAPDEGPYLQSAQGPAHQAAIEALWESGALYACDCRREEIDERTRQRAAAGDPTPGYDGHCRDRGLSRGEGRALRFRTPDDGVTAVSDLVRGDVEFPNRATEDFICVKGNGKPLFALANVVDDRTMAITHVFRGEEHLPNTPKQMMLWWALNDATDAALPLPAFAHLPLLVNEQGKKLSKRRDPVAVEMYREQGYLAAAFRNYLALLGWSPGEEEIVPLATLIGRFRIEDVQRSPAFFDIKKLTHMNGVYIRELSAPEFVDASLAWVHPSPGAWAAGDWSDPDTGTRLSEGPRWPADRFNLDVFTRIAPVVQERVSMLGEVPAMVDFLFLQDPPIDPDSWEKAIGRDELAPLILQTALKAYAACAWTRDELHEVTARIGETNGRALGKAQAPIRVAVTGRRVGPPLFESLEVLGRDETRRRISAALERLARVQLMLFGPVRLALRIFSLLVSALVVYFAVSLVQVWLTSRQYDPHSADAIMVMGAAQYNGVPSPDLAARLNEALKLFNHKDADLIVLTGGKEKGDVYTEAEAGARYLESKGVPAGDILQAGGNTTYQNVAEAAPLLKARHALTVLVTTDPFHEDRSMAISSSFGLTPLPTPTQTSPITGWSTVPYFLKEAVGVGLGRIIGFNHLDWLHDA